MKITMVPGSCETPYQRTGGSFCEGCFARFLMHDGDADLPCMTQVEDDGAATKTLVMQVGPFAEAFLLTDETRERLAYGEWRGWVDYVARVQAAHT